MLVLLLLYSSLWSCCAASSAAAGRCGIRQDIGGDVGVIVVEEAIGLTSGDELMMSSSSSSSSLSLPLVETDDIDRRVYGLWAGVGHAIISLTGDAAACWR